MALLMDFYLYLANDRWWTNAIEFKLPFYAVMHLCAVMFAEGRSLQSVHSIQCQLCFSLGVTEKKAIRVSQLITRLATLQNTASLQSSGISKVGNATKSDRAEPLRTLKRKATEEASDQLEFTNENLSLARKHPRTSELSDIPKLAQPKVTTRSKAVTDSVLQPNTGGMVKTKSDNADKILHQLPVNVGTVQVSSEVQLKSTRTPTSTQPSPIVITPLHSAAEGAVGSVPSGHSADPSLPCKRTNREPDQNETKADAEKNPSDAVDLTKTNPSITSQNTKQRKRGKKSSNVTPTTDSAVPVVILDSDDDDRVIIVDDDVDDDDDDEKSSQLKPLSVRGNQRVYSKAANTNSLVPKGKLGDLKISAGLKKTMTIRHILSYPKCPTVGIWTAKSVTEMICLLTDLASRAVIKPLENIWGTGNYQRCTHNVRLSQSLIHSFLQSIGVYVKIEKRCDEYMELMIVIDKMRYLYYGLQLMDTDQGNLILLLLPQASTLWQKAFGSVVQRWELPEEKRHTWMRIK